ncbi:MAG: GAF domain-containing protein [Actinomycetota bacterium]|nr:GAF domain-containing protein [Actinomycetota bacterium]
MNERFDLEGLPLDTLLQRQKLFEKLTRVQRSISHGAPLQDVLDAITAGASELTGDEVVALRLIDDDNPNYCVIVSSSGVKEHLKEKLKRTPVGQGAGGLAIRSNELVVIDNYEGSALALKELVKDGLKSAMAAPVHENGEPVGSLVVASYREARAYSEIEQEVLLSFAQHASLALVDAKAVEAMREAQRSKDMFLAMVSHELKSPLTVILGTLYTLQKHHQKIPEDARGNMLEAAYERAKELGSLVNRVLEGARAELAASKEDVLLKDLVDTSLQGFDQTCPLEIQDIPQVLVTVDPGAVRQVLGILLENAVSHSPDQTPVSVGGKVEGNDVSIWVANEGTLPSDIDRDSLFSPFSRGTGAASPGVGLGLYIASRLTTAIGGRIDVEADDGRVRFILRFLAQQLPKSTRTDRLTSRR